MRPHSSRLKIIPLLVLALTAPVQAGEYPTKPVKIIVAVGPGSTPDVMARIIADLLTPIWKQQVLVVNRPGGSGIIAAQTAAASEPDGHTLYFGTASTFVVLPEIHEKLPFDVRSAFTAISLVSEQPLLFAAAPRIGVNTLADAIALAKQKPEGLQYAAYHRGSLPNVTAEMLARRAGIRLTHIPYPAAATALNDVIGGRVSLVVETLSGLSGAVANGTIKPLAITSAQRLPGFPDLPTVSETIPGFEAMGWFALLSPSGVSDEIVQKVNHDLHVVLTQDDLQERFAGLGTFARPMSPSGTMSFIRSEQDRWRPLVRELTKAP